MDYSLFKVSNNYAKQNSKRKSVVQRTFTKQQQNQPNFVKCEDEQYDQTESKMPEEKETEMTFQITSSIEYVTVRDDNLDHTFNDEATSTNQQTKVQFEFASLEECEREIRKLEELYSSGFLFEEQYMLRKDLLQENRDFLSPVPPLFSNTKVFNEDYEEEKEEIDQNDEIAYDDYHEPEIEDEQEQAQVESVDTKIAKPTLNDNFDVTATSNPPVNRIDEFLSRESIVEPIITQKEEPIISMESSSFFPLIAHCDIPNMKSDIIVISAGCFLGSGFLADALTQRYGPNLVRFLRKRYHVGHLPSRTPPYSMRTKKDIDIKGNGGLQQGFASFIPSKDLLALEGVDPSCPPLVLAIVGGEYQGHVTPVTVSQLVDNVFNVIYSSVSQNKSFTVAFPTFGIGRGGNQHDRMPIINSLIESLHRNHLKYRNILPVLSCYSDTVHRLSIASRSKLLNLKHSNSLPHVLKKQKQMDVIPELQQELASDRLVLFVGAGVSKGSGLPTWQEFVDKLGKEANVPMGLDQLNNIQALLEISELIRTRLGPKFGEAVKRSLGYGPVWGPLPSLTHYLLASLPTKTIVTTNFDNLLETSLKCIKKAAFTINTPKDVAKTPMGEQVNVLKIHGDFSSPNEIVLSKSDYEGYFTKRPAVSTLLRGLLLNRTFLFVGYSLRDINLHIILNEVSSLLQDARRPAYAIVFDSNDEEVEYWSKRGIKLLTLSGEGSLQKTVSLWQFLDILQIEHFAPHGAWLAEDSYDLLPENSLETQLNEELGKLQKSLVRLTKIWNACPSNDLADFLLPWLLLGTKHGLSLHSDNWDRLSDHFMNREPKTEVNHLKSLTATISALQSSTGRWEHQYKDKLDQLEKEFIGGSI